MYDDIIEGKYRCKVDPPVRLKNICKKCHTRFYKGSIPNFCSKCGHPVKDEAELDKLQYKKDMAYFRAECSRVEDLFKSDALKFCGIEDHPNADKCFSLAWEYGHSDGYRSVLEYLEELSELLS